MLQRKEELNLAIMKRMEEMSGTGCKQVLPQRNLIAGKFSDVTQIVK
jgi:hypothetical protein